MTAAELGSVNVLNKIIYDVSPRRIGSSKLSVPAGFWKMIKNEKTGFEKCFYFENKKVGKGTKLRDFAVKCPLI